MVSANKLINTDFKLGVLGGGQLGKMLALAAGNLHLPIHMLDQDPGFPAGPYSTSFTKGSFKDYDDVYNFGKDKDVLTIEIEHVNTDALKQLAAEGVIVHPAPDKLEIIKDKGLQKQFYAANKLPTSPFKLYADENELRTAIAEGQRSYPFVQKSRTAGYDGKGVAVIRSEADLDKLLPGACMVEELVDMKKELAVIVARNESGQTACFPLVEMEFHPTANLVEFLSAPAQVSTAIEEAAEALAVRTIEAFDLCGLLAVELFLDQNDELLINEVAPRTHNSGHHTIDSCYTSQFEQQLRAILNLPLGCTRPKTPAAIMVNLLGADGYTGDARYDGLDTCMRMEGVNLHLYGKKTTKPFRKMGHATVIGDELDSVRELARKVKDTLIIKTM